MNQQAITKWSAMAVGSVVGTWMRLPHPIQILLMLMGLDILSGLFAGARTRTLNSSIMVRGLFQKLAVFPVLAMLHIVETPLKFSFEFEAVAACAFIVYESMSIIENAARAGLPIPTLIVNALVKAKVQTASPEEIQRQFASGDESTVSISKSSEIIKTPASLPDLKVEKKVTTLEETHVEPVAPPKP